MEYEDVATDPRLALIYEQSEKLLDQQSADLASIRTRASVTLSAGSIATSFLAPQALRVGEWDGVLIAATVLLIAAALLDMAILIPIKGWGFSHKPQVLLDVYVDGPKPRSIQGMHRTLALANQTLAGKNRCRLDVLYYLYTASVAALALSIALWLRPLIT